MTRTLVVIALLAVLIPAVAEGVQRTYGDVENVQYDTVIDGDTFKATIPGWPGIIGDSIRIRLANVCCLETRGQHDSSYQAIADSAEEFARGVLEGAKVITLKNIKRGRNFRIVADVFVDGKDLGKMLKKVTMAFKCDADWKLDTITVSITEFGEKYHREGCQHLASRENVTSLGLEDAFAIRRTPCKTCKPPGFDGETP